MLELKLSADEWAWALATLIDLGKKMPNPGGASRTGYRANGWDLDDLYESARSDACLGGAKVWTAVEARARDGVWPKVKGDETRMLRARWKAAQGFVELVLAEAKKKSGLTAHVQRPKEPMAVLRALLLDYWDAYFVDDWLAENLTSRIYWDHYDGEGPTDEFYDWSVKVDSGRYSRRS
jgi:hypothetical protein